ncbi:MAG: histidine ammonia-lyase [Candidatus Anammoxibacter sp.]
MNTIPLGVKKISIDDLATIARKNVGVRLEKEAESRIIKARKLVEKWVKEEKTIYGITTGFGALNNVIIPKKDLKRLQKNIILSHSAGVGNPLDEEIVRAVMALRIKDFTMGHSGIRLETVICLQEVLNNGIHPVVPEKGSVGASGDLAPLAHLSLVLLGLGEAFLKGKRMPGKEALKRCGIKPLQLEPPEGLALVNGTQVMTAIGGLAVYDAIRLSKTADIAASISLEVLLGNNVEFDPRIHQIKPHPGQIVAADNMRRITQNSEIISSHKDCSYLQDAYTLRCSPQVHGASKDAMEYARNVVEIEMNSATNNPLIFPESGEFLIGGNFHGQHIALAMDFLTMAVSEQANIAERRIERLVNPQLSGLPAFLVSDGGINSGFMIAQYTAAALVSENKVLSHPACVDSIPTSANKEDHVSMGTISARKCREVVKNSEHVIAIELLCGAQALDLFTNLKPGKGTSVAFKTIRETVKHLDKDRVLSKDIEAVVELIRSEKMLTRVEKTVGKLR